jgi:heat shock protein HslJ
MRRRTAITIALASVLLLGACTTGGGSGSPGPDGSAPGGQAPQGLDGRTFLSTAIVGRVLAAGSRVRLSFADGRVSAGAGCNSMGGSYAIVGGRLVVRDLATTEMGCDPQLMDQDRWVADLLDGAAITLDGDTLTLTDGGTRLTLLDREVADPDRPLLGTRWILDGLISGSAVSSVPLGVTAALTFSDGRVDVEAGCNSGGGTVEVGETTLAFGGIGLTRMACGPDAMATEQAVMAVLSGTVGYTIEAGTLTLDAGGRGLILSAAP